MAAPPISIKLRCASWKQLAAIYERDLTRSAVFLKSAAPPPVGTRVRINLTLPTQTLIVLNGSVDRHVGPGELNGRGPGVDIKLQNVPQSALWLIESALESARRKGAMSAGSGSAESEGGAAEGGAEADGTEAGATGTDGPAAEDGIESSTEGGTEGSGEDGGAEEMDIAAGEKLVEAEDDLIRALTQELASLRKLNPFQVLGVGYDTTDEEVRAAFASLTKRYHPDRFARYESGEARRIAAEIFILIRNAYQSLDSAAKRTKATEALNQRRRATQATPPPVPPTPPPIPPQARAQTPPPIPTAARATPPELPAPAVTTPPAPPTATPPASEPQADDAGSPDDPARAYALLDAGQIQEALALFKVVTKRNPNDRAARIGLELAEGHKALADRDRLEAAQRFEAVLELDPDNERAARELAEMRRQATNERKSLLTRLLNQKE